ncbi:unnamed protein product [Polarella glacialis]|uniref:Uncharacterized protein n=1 Tax=Polarella glacialis TaxID=89957 RepID=A0A813EEI1_POLGL|nr:unnamed protein product [Polarella glacialis]
MAVLQTECRESGLQVDLEMFDQNGHARMRPEVKLRQTLRESEYYVNANQRHAVLHAMAKISNQVAARALSELQVCDQACRGQQAVKDSKHNKQNTTTTTKAHKVYDRSNSNSNSNNNNTNNNTNNHNNNNHINNNNNNNNNTNTNSDNNNTHRHSSYSNYNNSSKNVSKATDPSDAKNANSSSQCQSAVGLPERPLDA